MAPLRRVAPTPAAPAPIMPVTCYQLAPECNPAPAPIMPGPMIAPGSEVMMMRCARGSLLAALELELQRRAAWRRYATACGGAQADRAVFDAAWCAYLADRDAFLRRWRNVLALHAIAAGPAGAPVVTPNQAGAWGMGG